MLVSSDLTNHVMTIPVQRFEHRTAVDRPTAAAIAAAMRDFDANDDAYVAVLYGEQTFCAGADLKAAAEMQGRENKLSPEGDGPMGQLE
jgi:enoyl-CoA hydratase